MKGTRQTWADMRNRCRNPRSQQWKNYGARGIKVCSRWDRFHNFLDDMGLRPVCMTLERIDNNGDYTPENCRWATRADQRRNQRDCIHIEYMGRRLTAEEWGRNIGIDPETIRRRLRKGWTMQEIVNPIRFRANQYTARAAAKGGKDE